MQHTFTVVIKDILKNHFGDNVDAVFKASEIIQYINEKTRSATKGSKSRSSFANLYAIYVIVEDYLANKFNSAGDYSKYEGAAFTKLFKRQRELPFGGSLQNHALNNRMNSEFKKFFPRSEYVPILRDMGTNRYWFNENLLKIQIGQESYNLAAAIIEIIDQYAKTKQDAFQRFIQTCEELRTIEKNAQQEQVIAFIMGLLAPNVDARLFEIVSYSILKFYYRDQVIFWGYDPDKLNKDNLQLFKTGRTNANDGGIDFVMKPLGRFFQVTETLDFKKYFLDIDKIQKFPITFVIKSNEDVPTVKKRIEDNAKKTYAVSAIVEKYMACIEEVINIPTLGDRFKKTIELGYLTSILDEIILQSKVEFNYEEPDEEEPDEEPDEEEQGNLFV